MFLARTEGWPSSRCQLCSPCLIGSASFTIDENDQAEGDTEKGVLGCNENPSLDHISLLTIQILWEIVLKKNARTESVLPYHGQC